MTFKSGYVIGEAYGFFNSISSKFEIKKEFESIHKYFETMFDLERLLIQNIDELKGDKKLIDIAKDAKQKGINFVMQSKYPLRTNEDAAEVARDILYQHFTRYGFMSNQPVNRFVVYEKDGSYISMPVFKIGVIFL